MYEYHLKFDDRRYAGSSEYRPSEGWVDVTDYAFGTGTRDLDVSVTIRDARVAALLYAAASRGATIGGAVLLARHEDDWVKYTLTDVIVSAVSRSGAEPDSVRLSLNVGKVTWTQGKGAEKAAR